MCIKTSRGNNGEKKTYIKLTMQQTRQREKYQNNNKENRKVMLLNYEERFAGQLKNTSLTGSQFLKELPLGMRGNGKVKIDLKVGREQLVVQCF